ncbi:hypothetical protein C8Q70DRAFT_566419 [Cubamyces menziesii]|nr:hypothetical protein C8Q70DRAFT_566419 [Cubamyces menziesii]
MCGHNVAPCAIYRTFSSPGFHLRSNRMEIAIACYASPKRMQYRSQSSNCTCSQPAQDPRNARYVHVNATLRRCTIRDALSPPITAITLTTADAEILSLHHRRYRGCTRGPRLGAPCRAWRPAVRDGSSYAKHPIRCDVHRLDALGKANALLPLEGQHDQHAVYDGGEPDDWLHRTRRGWPLRARTLSSCRDLSMARFVADSSHIGQQGGHMYVRSSRDRIGASGRSRPGIEWFQ